MNQRFYIGGRQYSPDSATVLCAFANLVETVTLYRSPKGAFFTITERDGDPPDVVLIDKEAAFEFMDAHPAGIDTDNYDEIFGEPEQG